MFLMTEYQFREAAYDQQRHMKSLKLDIGSVVGLMREFNVKFLEHRPVCRFTKITLCIPGGQTK